MVESLAPEWMGGRLFRQGLLSGLGLVVVILGLGSLFVGCQTARMLHAERQTPDGQL